MAEAATRETGPAEGARFDGIAVIEAAAPGGMITLRGDLASPEVAAAVQAGTGLGVPGTREMLHAGAASVAWMSPDELLVMVPAADLPGRLAAMQAAAAGGFVTLADVGDARARFRIRGPRAREVLMKLCPVDLAPAAFGPGRIRRTRAAQIAVALWNTDADSFDLVCFRSVAGYAFALLCTAAAPGSEVFDG